MRLLPDRLKPLYPLEGLTSTVSPATVSLDAPATMIRSNLVILPNVPTAVELSFTAANSKNTSNFVPMLKDLALTIRMDAP